MELFDCLPFDRYFVVCAFGLFSVSVGLVAKMAAFEASAESKIIPISTKIAELKKRITLAGERFVRRKCVFRTIASSFLASFRNFSLFRHRFRYWFRRAIFLRECTEGQKKATVEVWTEKERKATDTVADLRKTIKELSGKLMCHINASDGKHSANADADMCRTVTYPYGADSAQKCFDIYDLQVINRTKEFDRLDAQYVQQRKVYEQLQHRQTELEIYQKVSSEGRPAEEARPARSSAKGKQPAVDEDDSRKVVCRLENEIIRINEQWLQAETIGRKYKEIRGTLMGDATKFEQSLVEIENALDQQNGDIDNIEVGGMRGGAFGGCIFGRFAWIWAIFVNWTIFMNLK